MDEPEPQQSSKNLSLYYSDKTTKMSHSFNETVTSMNFFRRLSRMSTRTASDHEKSSDRTSENEIQPVNSYDKEAVPVSLQTSRAQGQVVDLETQNTPALDKDAFGDDAHEQGVHYKTMSWWHAGLRKYRLYRLRYIAKVDSRDSQSCWRRLCR